MKNSKMIKGIVAGALGLTLLLGGGTFALWYQNQSVASGSVQSGNLNFTVGAQTWAVVSNAGGSGGIAAGTSTPIPDISAFKMVPGDTVTLTTAITTSVIGTTMQATLKADLSGIVNTATPTGTDLLNAIKGSSLSTVKVDSGSAVAISGGGASVELTAASATSHTVVIALHFPAYQTGDPVTVPARTSWWGQTAQNQGIDLSSIKIDLAQHF
jgi:alternate signal-mediated exported protein